MGQYIDDQGRFQSEGQEADKIILSFQDQAAWPALAAFSESCWNINRELAMDIYMRLLTLKEKDS